MPRRAESVLESLFGESLLVDCAVDCAALSLRAEAEVLVDLPQHVSTWLDRTLLQMHRADSR